VERKGLGKPFTDRVPDRPGPGQRLESWHIARIEGPPKESQMKQNRGQGLVEYLILTCLVSVAAIAVVGTVGKNIREQYANISAALRNGNTVKLTAPEESTHEMRGMDDFGESARTKN
jgi:pilus assembly protein Flp/PilA